MRTVTAVVVAYGTVPLLGDCVRAISSSTGVDVDVVVVDNGADRDQLRAAERTGAHVIAAPTNLGFGGGCNLGAANAGGDVLAFINPDVIIEADALRELCAALEAADVGIATASVRLLDEAGLLNSSGDAIHFLGLGWADGYLDPIATATTPRDVAAASGATMAITRDVFERLGRFTPELFLYHEDAELSLRCWISGLRVRYVPTAISHHRYEFGRNPQKLYNLERNRIVLLVGCLERRTLALLAPALVLFELGITVVALEQGWLGEKVRAWLWLVRNRTWLATHRRAVQARRRVADRDLIHLFATRFSARQVALPGPLRPFDAALAGYWRLVSKLM